MAEFFSMLIIHLNHMVTYFTVYVKNKFAKIPQKLPCLV